jgi:hypothetical protein
MTGWCSRCCAPVAIGLPVEPLYTLASAALLIPATESGLRQLLSRHKDKLAQPSYRRHPRNPRIRVRYVTAGDIVTLRSILFSHQQYKTKNPKKETN